MHTSRHLPVCEQTDVPLPHTTLRKKKGPSYKGTKSLPSEDGSKLVCGHGSVPGSFSQCSVKEGPYTHFADQENEAQKN